MSSSIGGNDVRAGKAPKRALPSWMSARDDAEDDKSRAVDDSHEESAQKKTRGQGKERKDTGEGSGGKKKSPPAGPSSDFSKLLNGVVFALSGFVNPERGMLRSKALEMGAEYQPDWNPKCTLLVCAFQKTPKFQQVQADGGTIVTMDWIEVCYTHKKLVDIEPYLMHVGKPWKKNTVPPEENQACETPQPSKPHKNEVKQSGQQSITSSSAKDTRSTETKLLRERFSPMVVKKWAVDDLKETLAWLESQEEKPAPSEIRNVAAEGILTCLQDAVDLLDQDQDLQQLTEQWGMVPHVVEEIIKVQTGGNCFTSKEVLHQEAVKCKKIYEEKLKELLDGSNTKEPKVNSRNKGKGKLDTVGESRGYDSDETIEMTEDEITNAYNSIASTVPVA